MRVEGRKDEREDEEAIKTAYFVYSQSQACNFCHVTLVFSLTLFRVCNYFLHSVVLSSEPNLPYLSTTD